MPNTSGSQMDRRHPYLADGAEDYNEGPMHGANGLRAWAGEVVNDLAETVKEHPYATLAVAAGLAFTIGALWKVRASSRKSELQALMARLPELPSAQRLRSYRR
jgi:hypothetical protein